VNRRAARRRVSAAGPHSEGPGGGRGFADSWCGGQREGEAAHMMPEKVARGSLFLPKLNSRIAYSFSPLGHLAFQCQAGHRAMAIPRRRPPTPRASPVRTWTRRSARATRDGNGGEDVYEDRGKERAERRAVAERDAHADGHAQVTHRRRRSAPRTLTWPREVGPPQRWPPSLALHAEQVIRHERRSNPGDDPAKKPPTSSKLHAHFPTTL
jgi:hypothetical protein